jgi:nitroimidazol reductase NimA-like FMN-containing flavoprotein (pyridoxamine 5'-phosphate oxidase superfamily)
MPCVPSAVGRHRRLLGMAADLDPVTELSTDQSWDLISAMALGRLVTVVGGRPEIFPVNFVVQHHTVLFRTAEGTKLFSVAANDQVLFEADDHNVADAWSVVIRGSARMLITVDEIHQAERAGLYPWIATEKLRFVRITPAEVTGRRFVFGPEPDAGTVPG